MDYFLGEFHAHALKGHPDYRVLRRVEGRSPYPRDVPSNAQTGILIHVDTTGPNPDGDEIIVLAMIRFAFTEKGTIFGPLESYLGLNQPKKPIPPYVTRATGITDEAVKGKRINARFVGDFIKTAELIVCHDAARARRFCERLQSDFQHRAWACSRVQIRWSHEGVGCTELPSSRIGRATSSKETRAGGWKPCSRSWRCPCHSPVRSPLSPWPPQHSGRPVRYGRLVRRMRCVKTSASVAIAGMAATMVGIALGFARSILHKSRPNAAFWTVSTSPISARS